MDRFIGHYFGYKIGILEGLFALPAYWTVEYINEDKNKRNKTHLHFFNPFTEFIPVVLFFLRNAMPVSIKIDSVYKLLVVVISL